MSNKPEIKFIKSIRKKRELEEISNKIKIKKHDSSGAFAVVIISIITVVFFMFLDWQASIFPYVSYKSNVNIKHNPITIISHPIENIQNNFFTAELEKFAIPLLLLVFPFAVQSASEYAKDLEELRLKKEKLEGKQEKRSSKLIYIIKSLFFGFLFIIKTTFNIIKWLIFG